MSDSSEQQGRKRNINSRRRKFLTLTGTGAAGLLAGCSRQDNSNGNGGNGANVGNIEQGPLSGKTIKIGTLSPDPHGWPVGTGVEEGAQLAIEEINQDGGLVSDTAGIHGANLELYPGDTKLAPATGRREYLRLVENEDVDLTTGIFFDRVALQILKPMAANKTIHITSANPGTKTAPLVHDRYDEFKYYFRVCPAGSRDLAMNEEKFLEVWSERADWDRVALLVENIDPFEPFWNYLHEEGNIYDIDGIEVPVAKRTSSGQADFTSIYNELEENDVDFAAVNFVLTATAATVQWANQKRPFEFGSILVPAQSSSFWKETNGRCEYAFTMDAHTPYTEQSPHARPFSRRYIERFDRGPVYTAGGTYDAVNMFAAALEQAVQQEGLSSKPGGDLMVDYLEKLEWEKSTVFGGDPHGFLPPDRPLRAHDPTWEGWEHDGVPMYKQWQHPDRGARHEPVSPGEGVMESFAPDMTATSNYAVPHWIDKEIDYQHDL